MNLVKTIRHTKKTMPAKQRYLTSLHKSFSTFLTQNYVSGEIARQAESLYLKLLGWKTDYTNWSIDEIRQFLTETQINTIVLPQVQSLLTQFVKDFPPHQANIFLHEYLLAIKQDGCSSATIRNYRSDIRQYVRFSQTGQLKTLFTKPKLAEFVSYQLEKGLKESSITRKLSSVSQFGWWLQGEGLITQDLEWINQASVQSLSGAKFKKIAEKRTGIPTKTQFRPGVDAPRPTLGQNQNFGFKKRLRELTNSVKQTVPTQTRRWLLPYLNLAFIALVFLGLGYFGYRQLFVETAGSLAYPSTPTRPNRVLSFQGRLTDSAQNPLTTSTNMRFYLYDALSGGSQLWDSTTCAVTPDQDGIFTVNLGDDCGSEIGSGVFSENANIWLEALVEAETLTPRQPIRTVAYALNAETVQGYPIDSSGSATVNTILTMNSVGDIVLGEVSPKISAVSGNFTLEGEALTLSTTSGSGGDITFSPDGIGGVISTAYFQAPGATLSATYAGGTALTLKAGPTATADIMQWQNSAGTPLGVIDESGNIGIGIATPLFKLDVAGTASVNSLNINDQFTFPTADGTTDYILQTNGSGAVSWIDPTSLSTNEVFWGSSLGSLYPLNSTMDVFVGGQATASAKFAFTNIDSGTPTFSMATQASAFDLKDSTVDALNIESNLMSFDTSNSRVGIGTATPTQVLDVNGNIQADSFFDSADNSYFLDPAATGDSLTVAGNIGIGTTTPTSQLEIFKSGSTLQGGPAIRLMRDYTGSDYGAAIYNGWDATVGDALIFGVGTNSNPSGAGQEKMIITQAGNVGIGTTAPVFKLDIAGNASISGTLSQGPMLRVDAGTCNASAEGKQYYDAEQNKYYYCNGSAWAALGSGGGSSYWRLNLGTISPVNDTLDLLIGANATSSAKFAFTNIDSGTPTLSMANQASAIDLTNTTVNALDIEGGLMSFDTTNSRVGIGITAPLFKLDVAGTASVNSLNINDQFTFPTTDGTASYILQTDGAGAVSWADPAGAAASAIYWNTSLGALYPKNSTMDLLVGGQATSSAKFAVLNMDSGTPTASVSAGVAGASYLTADGTLQTTANQLLTLGGNTTGEIYLSGNVGVGTATPTQELEIEGADNIYALIQGTGANSTAGVRLQNDVQEWITKISSDDTFRLRDQTNTTDIFVAEPGATANRLYLDSTGNVGIGTATPDAELESLSTAGEQLRLTYTDGSAYAGLTVDTNGDLSINASGGDVTLAGGDNLNLTAATDIVFGGVTSLGETTSAIDSGAYVVGAFDEFDYSAATDVQGVLNDLDSVIAGIIAGTSGVWTDAGTHLYPTSAEYLGNSTTAGANKLAGAYLADSAPVTYGTDNDVSYAFSGTTLAVTTGTNDINFDSNTLFVDGSAGNVGIGNAAPASMLSVGATSQFQINSSGIIATIDSVAHIIDDVTGNLTLTSNSGATSVVGDLYISSGISLYGTAVSNSTIEADKFCTGDGETNCITDFSSVISPWTDVGSYLHPTSGEVLGNSGSGVTNKIAGIYMTDSAPLTFGLDNDVTFSFSGTELATTLGTNTWNIASNLLFLNGSSNLIGIGTNNPLATLDIRSTLGTVPTASISGNTSMASLIVDQSGSGDIFAASSSGETRFVVSSDGNVGIGVQDPSSKLEIGGSTSTISNDSGDITINAASNFISLAGDSLGNLLDLSIAGDASVSGAIVFDGVSPSTIDVLNGNRLDFQTSVGGDAGLGVVVSILNNGNVGLGTTTPTQVLDVNGNIQTDSLFDSANNAYYLDPAATGDSLIVAGNVGINTLSPSLKLEILDGSNPQLRLSNTDTDYIDFQSQGSGRLGISTYDGTNTGTFIFDGESWGDYALFGSADTKRALLGLAGGLTGETSGGILRLHTSADHDTTIDYYGVQVSADDLNIGPDTDLNSLSYLGGTGDWSFTSTTGNVGIGTSVPEAALHVVNSNASSATIMGASLGVSGDYSSLELKGTSSILGGGFIDFGYPSDDNEARIIYTNSDDTLNIQNQGSGISIISTGNVGIGDATPTQLLDVNGNIQAAIFYDKADNSYYLDPAATGTSLATAGDVTIAAGTGKLDVGTVDPPFTINGEKYATYVASMTGVKEETTGMAYTNEYVAGKGYRYTIDFTNQPKGSDLWLFSQVTNLKEQLGETVVLLSPAGNTQAWYTLDTRNHQISIYSGQPTHISYRLTAPRFDTDTWSNYRNNDTVGFVLNDPDDWELNPDGTILGDLVAAISEVFDTITAQVAQIDKVITPTIELQPDVVDEITGEIEYATLEITDSNEKTVAKFNSRGDLTLLGELSAASISAQTIDVATISARSARIDQLESRMADFEQIKAQTAELVDATISGTLYATKIDGLDDQLAETLNESSFLDKLLGKRDEATESASLASLFTLVEDAGYATDSGSLIDPPIYTGPTSDVSLVASSAFINDYFSVNGSGYVAQQLGIGEQLLVGNSMAVGSNYIEYQPIDPETPRVLHIQPSGQGTLSLMAGLMTLHENGQVLIDGDLAISGDLELGGTLLTNLIEPTSFDQPLQIKLATQSGLVAGTATASSRLEILGITDIPTATISAQGRASFDGGLNIGTEDLTPISTMSATIASKQPSGKATIRQNTLGITIKSSLVTKDSLIYVSSIGSTGNQILYVKSQTPEDFSTLMQEGGFSVGFDVPINNNATFNWWIVN